MADERNPIETPPAPTPAMSSCRRKKGESGSFVGYLRDHAHEFIHASINEHKTCLHNTIKKIMSKMSRAVCRKEF